MLRPTALVMLATVVGMPFGALASECIPTLDRTTDVDIDLGVKRYYVDTECIPICLQGTIEVVTYEESNGIDRLQRQDDAWDDTCSGLIQGDTLINPL